MEMLVAKDRIAVRYCEPDGRVTASANPNGSVGNVAGILNERGNVLGMMPHPERAGEPIVGGEDGNRLWASLVETLGGWKGADRWAQPIPAASRLRLADGRE